MSGRPVPPHSHAAFAAARERYLERMRVDAETRRLERLWLLPPYRDAPRAEGADRPGHRRADPA